MIGYLPNGAPRYWRDEKSGKLGYAVQKFILAGLGRTAPPTAEEFGLVKDYFLHWVKSPLWKIPRDLPYHEALEAMENASTQEELAQAVLPFVDYGIDPL